MHVTIEQLGGLERRMTFGIPEQRIYDAVQQRVRELARQVKLDGFRKGKVPVAVVQQKLGPQVRQGVIGDMLLTAFYEAAAQEKLKLASQPRIALKEPPAEAAEAPPEFTATFEVYPEFDLAPPEAIRIERPVAQIGEEDVDGMLAALRRLHLDWVAVDRPAQTGDRVMVDLQGYMDDEPLREIRQIPFILGRPAQGGAFGNIVQDEFAHQIEGVRPGNFVDMDIGFPDEYPKAYLAGQTVRFTLHLRSVEESRLPELDDAFALALGVEEGGMAALREQTRQMMAAEMRQAGLVSVKAQVLDALLAHNPLELPKARVEAESAQLLERVAARMKADGLKEEDIEIAALLVEEQARRRIGLGLILAKIVRDNALSVPKESLDSILEKTAPRHGNAKAAEEWRRRHEDLAEELESTVLEEQVVDWVLERAQVVDKAVGFGEFMKGRL